MRVQSSRSTGQLPGVPAVVHSRDRTARSGRHQFVQLGLEPGIANRRRRRRSLRDRWSQRRRHEQQNDGEAHRENSSRPPPRHALWSTPCTGHRPRQSRTEGIHRRSGCPIHASVLTEPSSSPSSTSRSGIARVPASMLYCPTRIASARTTQLLLSGDHRSRCNWMRPRLGWSLRRLRRACGLPVDGLGSRTDRVSWLQPQVSNGRLLANV
jgi:hypothetical protein